MNTTTTPIASRSGLLRALSVLDFIVHHAPTQMGVTQVAREMDLPKAVAYRILKDFTQAGYLDFDETTKLYSLGGRALGLGMAAMQTVDVSSIARPHMEELMRLTHETTTLSMRQGWKRMYIDQIESDREIRMSVSVGSTHSLHAGSSSKAILAAMDDADITALFAHRAAETGTGGDHAAEWEELERVRRRGYAVSRGERQVGAGSVAAPIISAGDVVWGSISICGPADRFHLENVEQFGELVAAAAREISAELGHMPDAVEQASA